MKPIHLTLLVLALAAGAAAQDDRIAQERARRDLLAQKTILMVERHLANARAFEERLDLAAAERELQAARALDPANRVVQDTLAQVQALLGRPEAEARVLAVSAAERYAAQQQQMQVFARQDLAQAEALLAAGDGAEAERLARGVVNTIRWSSASTDWGDLGPRASQVLQRAEAMAGGSADSLRAQREAEAYARLQQEERDRTSQAEARHVAMLDTAWQRFMANDFDGAAELARAVLDEDQGNIYAQDLLDATRDARRDHASERFRRDRAESFARWRETMEAVRVPYNDVLTGPDKDHWAEITRLRGGGRSLGLGAMDPEEAALRERLLGTRMDADFEEMTLEQVANNIFFSTDIPVSVDPEVSQELDDVAEYVNLKGLRDLPVHSLLNILIGQVGEDLAWTVRNGRIYITKRDKAAGAVVVRIHNIQDLTVEIVDFKGPTIRDIPLPGEYGDDPETTVFSSELEKVKLIEPDEVLNLVRENIARESWDTPPNSIDIMESQGALLVINTPEVQQQVLEFLQDLRTYSKTMVTLESRFYALTDAFIEEIGTDLRGLGPSGQLGTEFELDDIKPEALVNPGTTSATVISNTQGLDNNGDGTGAPKAGVLYDGGDQLFGMSSEYAFNNPLGALLSTVGGGAFQFTILDDTQLNIVLTAIEKSRSAFEISSPIVSVYNTQRAFVSVVNQVSYVAGYDVDVATAAFIADPYINVVQEGIVLDVRPTISFDRKYITLDVQTTVANLVRPFREITTNLGGSSTEVKIFLPQLDVQDAQTTVVVPDRGSVLLGGFKQVLYRNRTAEAPWLADIPVLGFFFREKGLADEMTDLIIVMRATISDFSDLEQAPVSAR